MDDATADSVRELMAKGFAGTVFLTTDACQASYEELKGRGVEFTDLPEERRYGIDSGFRDPSGNSFRLTQVREIANVYHRAKGATGRGINPRPVASPSGRLDSNQRPPGPKPGALPDCATPRPANCTRRVP